MTRLTQSGFALSMGTLIAATVAPATEEEQAIARTPDHPAIEWAGCPEFMPEGCQIGVLHGTPADPNVDIFYQVPGGAEIARHWHSSPERMVLVTGEMSVTYDGQDPVILEPGNYAYGPAKKPHSATCRSSEPCTLFIAFVAPVDAREGAPE